MKKLFYALVLMAAGLGFVACDDDEAKNPGDFNLKSTLEMDTKIVSTQGFEGQLELLESRDTTYEYQVTKYDTLKDENNKPILDAEGKLQITTETSWGKGRTDSQDARVQARYTAFKSRHLHLGA